jgi:hypothetical protein
MTRTTALSRQYHYPLAVMLLLGMACSSPARFPGASGWLGCAGLLLLAATFLVAPSLRSANKARRAPHGRLTLLAIGSSLMLMLASVIVWSGTSA